MRSLSALVCAGSPTALLLGAARVTRFLLPPRSRALFPVTCLSPIIMSSSRLRRPKTVGTAGQTCGYKLSSDHNQSLGIYGASLSPVSPGPFRRE